MSTAPTAEPKICQYEVIRRSSLDELAPAVSGYLNCGWELAGGVSCAPDVTGTMRDGDGGIETGWLFIQAIWRVDP